MLTLLAKQKRMKKYLVGLLAVAGLAVTLQAAPKKVLVVTVTTGFRHSSIPTAEKILGMLAKETGDFTVDYVQQPDGRPNPKKPGKLKDNASAKEKAKYDIELANFKAEVEKSKDAEKAWQEQVKQNLRPLSPENLKKYDAVFFVNTTGDLPLPDPKGFIQWIEAGHAFVGMHSAADTFHGFPLYREMLGAEFKTHGPQVSVDAINEDNQCAACKHLPAKWTVYDEIYQMKNFDRTKVHGLLTLDKHPNDKTPGDYPIAWKKEYGKGRVFYTSLGHREDIWDAETPENFKRMNPKEVSLAYQKHIMGGIRWALGLEQK